MTKFISSILALLCLMSAVQARTITFDDLYSVPQYGDPQISPDGKQIVFELSVNDPKKNAEENHLWLMNADGSELRQLTFGKSGESHPRWSTEGKGIFFLSSREEGEQVWLLPLSGGEARRVTSLSTPVSSFEFLPPGRELMLTTRVFPECHDDSCNKARLAEAEKAKGEPKLYDHLLFRHYSRWDDGRVNRIILFSMNNSSSRELYASKYDVPTALLGGNRDIGVSPEGKEYCFAMCTDSMPTVGVNNDLYIIAPPATEPVRFTDGPGLEGTPRYSPDGRYLAYLATARAVYESDQRKLVLYDRMKKTSANLTADFDRSIGDYYWDSKSQYIYFTCNDEGYDRVYRISIPAGKIELLLGDAVYGDIRVSPDGKYLLVSRSWSDRPYELCRFDLATKKVTLITHRTESVTAGIEMNRAEEFRFAGALGDSVHGFVTRPPAFDPQKRYPLALLIHGGPQFNWTPDFNYYGWNTQLMAAQGYVVAQINIHGSSGYGQKFQDYISGNWGKGDFEDLMKGVDFLLSRYTFIDSTRMAALGRSYGGFMTNWICGHSNRFKCLVTIDGTFNHVAEYGSTDELWFPEWEYQGTPYDNWDEYVRSSPVYYAKNFKTPTLVIHGQRDYRVDLSEGLQMFTALQRQGVPSELLYFPDEGHSVGQLSNLRIVYDRQMEWLAKWLK
jgi:dipeptidyl aminopeptidase/acylaminoacyl peptidase